MNEWLIPKMGDSACSHLGWGRSSSLSGCTQFDDRATSKQVPGHVLETILQPTHSWSKRRIMFHRRQRQLACT